MQREEIEAWYDQSRSQYQDYVQVAQRLIETLLREEKIPYHSVSGRLKDRESYVEKCFRKEYDEPNKVMDLAGIRIITHTTAEIQRVQAVIEREFQVDPENSGDKAQEMGVDRVGYLSVHYVVRIGNERSGLREYARFAGLCLEIQVRSLLQHAWAEIEHDRGYKFAGKLPSEIERRFHLIAGTLELMDEEFRVLSEEIDQYAHHVAEQTQHGNLEIAIDSTSLLQFLEEYYKLQRYEGIDRNYWENSKEIIRELNGFGISTLRQLKTLLDNHPIKDLLRPGAREEDRQTNYVGLMREMMVLENPEKYFQRAWQENWAWLERSTLKRWEQAGISEKRLRKFLNFISLDGDEKQGDYTISLK